MNSLLNRELTVVLMIVTLGLAPLLFLGCGTKETSTNKSTSTSVTNKVESKTKLEMRYSDGFAVKLYIEQDCDGCKTFNQELAAYKYQGHSIDSADGAFPVKASDGRQLHIPFFIYDITHDDDEVAEKRGYDIDEGEPVQAQIWLNRRLVYTDSSLKSVKDYLDLLKETIDENSKKDEDTKQ